MKIIGAHVLGPDFQFHNQTIEIRGERIASLQEMATSPTTSQETSCDVVSYEGMKIIPGLIDVHMHGYRGHSCTAEDPDDLIQIAEDLAKEGVTGFAAGISTMSAERMGAATRAAVQASRQLQNQTDKALLLGIHLEGPFLNPQKKGAMDETAIQTPNPETLQRLLDQGQGLIRLITLAPEMPGAEAVIRLAVQKGVTVSMGHTMATYPEAKTAIRLGAARVTHTFNAMRPLGHRDSGILGAALLEDTVQCELIGDLVHVAPEICTLLYRLKGADRMTLISDSCQLAGLRPEELPEDVPIILKDAAYLPNGTLCGSIGTVMTMVRNMVSLGVPLEEAVRMASFNPARDLHCENDLGSIAPGKLANLVVLDDALRVRAVYINGSLVSGVAN